MRKRILHRTLVPGLLAALIVGSASGRSESPADARPAVPGEILVGFEPAVTAGKQDELLRRVGATRERRLSGIRGALVAVGSGKVAISAR